METWVSSAMLRLSPRSTSSGHGVVLACDDMASSRIGRRLAPWSDAIHGREGVFGAEVGACKCSYPAGWSTRLFLIKSMFFSRKR